MNRKLIFLNVALLALAGTLAWTLRNNWFSAQSRQSAVIQKKIEPKQILAPPPAAPGKPVVPADYLDVAARMLFSKDRNANVVIEVPPPKPAPPEPPMPALPSYHGQMAIGEPVAFLSTSSVAQRSYRAGESVGEFKLISFDAENIEFEWHNKSVKRRLDELKAKETAQAQAQAPAPNRPAAANAPGGASGAKPGPAGPVVSLGGSSGSTAMDTKDSGSDDPMFGPLQADGTRACQPSDSSPSGTVHSGYTKSMTVTLFGSICHWEQSK